MLGLSGGAAGTGFDAPGQANVRDPITQEQLDRSYQESMEGLNAQFNLRNALAQQGGIQKQGDVYSQLQNIAAGQGPNPAQAMLNQETSRNVANQAALMAGQRGAGANAGLMARQAAQTGGNLQQQAVGQGAINQANQSMNAINAMGNMANTMVGNQIGATSGYTGAQQANQANLLNAVNAANQARVGSQSSVNAGNAALANTQLQGQQAMVGGMMNMLGGGGLKGAQGGMVPGYADGGLLGVDTTMPQMSAPPVPSSASIGAMPPIAGVQLGASAPGAGGGPYQQAKVADVPAVSNVQQGPASSFGQFMSKVDAGAPAQQSQINFASSNPGAEALYKGMETMGKSLGKSMMSSGGGGGGGGGSSMMSMMPAMMAMMSDENQKKDVKSGDESVKKLLDALSAKEFKYKDSAKQDDKKHTGPMAQDLEKSSAGSQMVEDTPEGKMVDYSKAGPAILSSLAFLHKEIKGLKGEQNMYSGGLVDVMVSPGEKIIKPENVEKAAKGKVIAEKVPGKAKVSGDSEENDTVKKKLPPGSVIVKRTESENNRDSARFVRDVLAKRGRK